MEDRSLASTATITETNIERYMILVKTLDPELYAIKMALIDTLVNPEIVPEIIRQMANICYGTGYGNVRVSISERMVASIQATESESIHKPALKLKP